MHRTPRTWLVVAALALYAVAAVAHAQVEPTLD